MSTPKQDTFIRELFNQIRRLDPDALAIDEQRRITTEGIFPSRAGSTMRFDLRQHIERMSTREASTVINKLKAILARLEAAQEASR